ncbi:recombinase family protein [Streptomyces sp. NPDC005728]|uniref:recombinase family protein n=1 Tax=Streptomyces sp. NPDC005728 TaxID=3157054 RepID=UPI0033D97ED7
MSTGVQKLDRQIDALKAAGCRKIFADKKSGKNDLRPELKASHAFLDAGDTLVVPALDRYGRSLQDLINMVAELRRREIGFTSLHENLDTTTPGGRLVFHVFAALAEFIRELIGRRCRRESLAQGARSPHRPFRAYGQSSPAEQRVRHRTMRRCRTPPLVPRRFLDGGGRFLTHGSGHSDDEFLTGVPPVRIPVRLLLPGGTGPPYRPLHLLEPPALVLARIQCSPQRYQCSRDRVPVVR